MEIVTPQVEQLTAASIERIYKVNKIRDYLHRESVSLRLRKLGVESVVFWGSAMKGIAEDKSDIDLYATYDGFNEYEPFNSLRDCLRTIREKTYRTRVRKFFQKAEVGQVETRGSKILELKHTQQGNLNDILHLFLVNKNGRWFDKKIGKPILWGPIEDTDNGIEIWPS